MNDSREIVLAGKSYKITVPLTLQQLIDCNVGIQSIPDAADPDGPAQQLVSYQRAIKVVVAAMKDEHPEVTEEFLRNMRGFSNIREFNAATIAIYELSGLVAKKGDGASGEAKPATVQSTGSPSSDESQPL